MDDLYRAGGLLAVLREVSDLLDPDALTVSGRPLASHLGEARIWDETVIRPRSAPLQEKAGIAVLRGSLAPGGAVIKPAAATKELLIHRGPAVVFDSIEDMRARLDDPDLDVTEDSVLVLRGCGPRGYPGMPEVGNMPIPAKLLARGRAGHGADQRRPDERHRVRHGGPAHGARGSGGRPAGPGPRRRPGRAGRARPAAGPRRAARRNSRGASPPRP